MATPSRSFPAVQPHGDLREVLPDLFFVQGSFSLNRFLPLRFSRNMTIVRRGERLVLVNSVRLDETGLAAIDKLGKVTDVIRIAGAHGMDDPFYADRYGAKVWAIKGQKYQSGFDGKSQPYFEGHGELDASSPLPIPGAKLVILDAHPPEGLLLLPEHGGVMIAGDCLQNWAKPDELCTWMVSPLMRLGGFIKPHNIGPAWFKHAKPSTAQLRALLDLTWANVLPAHGAPVLGDASALYRPTFDRVVPAS